MIGGALTFILLLALGYMIFVHAGKQAGLNKTLGYVVVGIIVVALIALPVFACARHFGKGGFHGGMNKGFGPGKQECCPEIRQGGCGKSRGPNAQGCPMQGPQGRFEFRTDGINPNAFRGDKDIIVGRSMPGNPDLDPFAFRVEPFSGMWQPKDVLNQAASLIQKDAKLADEFMKALKDKPEAMKALRDKLK